MDLAHKRKLSRAVKARHAKLTPEQRRQRALAMNDAKRAKAATLSDEERAARSAAHSERLRLRHANASAEAKKKTAEKRRKSLLAYWSDKKGKQKGTERSRKISEAQKAVYAKLTPKQREARRKQAIKAGEAGRLVPRRPLTKAEMGAANEKRKATWAAKDLTEFSKTVRAVAAARTEEERLDISERRVASYHARSDAEKTATSKRLRAVNKARTDEDWQEINRRRYETVRANGTFNTSKPEDEAYTILCNTFGVKNVRRNFVTSLYPFACDFVVNVSNERKPQIKDCVFIECNFHWTHGGAPFDKSNSEHLARLRKMRRKAKSSDFHKTAVSVWSKRDVQKRELAQAQGLSWFEFWALDDLKFWLAKTLSKVSLYQTYSDEQLMRAYLRVAKGSPRYVNDFTFQFQPHFYQMELRLWNDLVARYRLLANRQKYLGKSALELSDSEILAGFRKSGVVRNRYSHFPVSLVKEFVQTASPASVYDPFSGWGTRLLAFHALGVSYTGNDAWGKTYRGCLRIAKWLATKVPNARIKLYNEDAADLDVSTRHHDSVFTCPPYPEGVEAYNNGAETLPLDEYWCWWHKVVNNSVSDTTSFFGLVIPERWQLEYGQPLKALGFKQYHRSLVLLSGRRDSHLVKRKNLEVMIVWRRS